MKSPSRVAAARAATCDLKEVESTPLEKLREFLETEGMRSKIGPRSFADFERELHERMMEAERDIVAGEMAHLDVDADAVVIAGKVHRRVLRQSQTYMTSAVPTSTLLVTGAALQVAPNIHSIAHGDRLLGGALYAPPSRVDWATLLRRTFDVDVTRCTGCAGRMTVRAVVTTPRPSTACSPRSVARATHPSPPDLATVQRATRRAVAAPCPALDNRPPSSSDSEISPTSCSDRRPRAALLRAIPTTLLTL